jgi:hypothetical protein
MNALAIIGLMFCLGCGSERVSGVKYQVSGSAPSPILIPDPSSLAPALIDAQPLSTIRPTNQFFLPFTYAVWPLTNGYLLSSTDLVHWSKYNDYWLTTNADHTVEWNIHPDRDKPVEFFRAGGETIGQ